MNDLFTQIPIKNEVYRIDVLDARKIILEYTDELIPSIPYLYFIYAKETVSEFWFRNKTPKDKKVCLISMTQEQFVKLTSYGTMTIVRDRKERTLALLYLM